MLSPRGEEPHISTCAWRNVNFRINSIGQSLPPSSMKITLRRYERCNFPDYSPVHHRRQAPTPSLSTTSSASSTSGSSGISGVISPGIDPILLSVSGNRSARKVLGNFIKARPGLLHFFFDKPARCSRVALCGTVLPWALPLPWPTASYPSVPLLSRDGTQHRHVMLRCRLQSNCSHVAPVLETEESLRPVRHHESREYRSSLPMPSWHAHAVRAN